jgi:phage gpG-like protein
MEFEVNPEQLASIMRRLDSVSPTGKNRILKRAMDAVNEMVRRQLVGNMDGKILHVRSGRLRGSMQSRVVEEGTNLTGITGSGVLGGKRVVYADIHETGGVIKQGARSELFIRKRRKRTTAKGTIGQFLKGRTTSGQGFTFKERTIRIPARRYMSRSLAEVSGQIMNLLAQRVEEGLAGKI